MGTRLYVGNLPYDVDEDSIKAFFEAGGRKVTQVKIVTDRDTGRPRGFAFVEMGDDAQALRPSQMPPTTAANPIAFDSTKYAATRVYAPTSISRAISYS